MTRAPNGIHGVLIGALLCLVAGLAPAQERPVRPVEPVLFAYSHFSGQWLKEPLSVFYDARADEVLVADTGNRMIVIFDPTGMPKFSFGSESGLKQPLGVMTDTRGRIYARVAGGPLVQVFSYRGEPLGLFPFTDKDGAVEIHPSAMTSSNDGKLFFADHERGRIVVYDEDWTFLLSFGHQGTGRGALTYPMGLAVGRRGELYVSDRMGIAIQVFSTDGRVLRAWGARDVGAKNFSTPAGIAVGPDDRVYVADTMRQDIKVFDPRGEFLYHFGGFGVEPGRVSYPRDVAVALDGRIWVCEKSGNRVQVFRVRDVPEAPAEVPDP